MIEVTGADIVTEVMWYLRDPGVQRVHLTQEAWEVQIVHVGV